MSDEKLQGEGIFFVRVGRFMGEIFLRDLRLREFYTDTDKIP